MGMDVIGRKPSSNSGRYFQAGCSSWGDLLRMTAELCGDIVKDELTVSMNVNDGEGVDNAAACEEMAVRLEHWLENHRNDIATSGFAELFAKEFGVSVDISTDEEHVKRWITFLESCGGFEVW